MYKRLYGTREGRNVILNPVPSHYHHLLLLETTSLFLNYLIVTKKIELTLKQKIHQEFKMMKISSLEESLGQGPRCCPCVRQQQS